eukprot:CAMPEP_0184331790 /NCGR_PEP_ID=MMETSP1089-20130417/1067_1 /TAXON_ID=38269 ORGANISM="Gloeochaete wittrockiana, Strain SAG46.84" /NCGR_SAMPLE_ID=MMETSP1089 /ASSEMBLY_ACC=CAM_ASM_000445 /LENGTH=354 /DNA_ID=CAMNT_0026654881 /DNA_START=36 /DNA_END=1100 /DNA_ORIENTATION=-
MMKQLSVVAILALLVVAASASDVKDLNADNFDTIIDGSTGAFIEFYAPWCGHCKKLAPEYEVVATAFKRFATKATIAKVDCDSHRDLCGRFGVTGYPTLKWFPKDNVKNPEPYSGGRTAADIIAFVNQKVGTKATVPRDGPSNVVDLTAATFDKVVLDASKDVFAEFYAPWCGHCKNLAPEYEKFGNAFANEPSVVVARIDCDAHKEACSRYGVTGYPTLKWFPKDSKAGQDYDRPRVASDLVAFVNEKAKTDRSVDGRLGATAGIIASLKDFVTEFKGATDKAEVATRAVAAANALATPAAKFYARVFEATAADASFVATELTRVERLLSSSSLSAKKVDEFTIRANILKSFA